MFRNLRIRNKILSKFNKFNKKKRSNFVANAIDLEVKGKIKS